MANDDIGDLSVDVTADLSKLEARLKAKLEELSKKLQAKIQVAVETAAAQASLTAWRARASTAKIILGAAVKTVAAKLDVDKFIEEQRSKAIELAVKISKQSLVNAAAQVKTLTGLTVVQGEVAKFHEIFADFFNSLPAVATKVLKFSSIISLAGTALGSLLVTINLLAAAGPGLVASLVGIPGILLGVGVQAGILFVAMKNAPPAVKAAEAAYKGLKKTISTNFWGPAAANAASFLKSIQGAVRTGFAEVSSASGTFFGSFASSLQSSLGGGVIDKIFANITSSVKAFQGASTPLGQIIANLGLFGTSLLPPISAFLTRITEQFNVWLSTSLSSGALYADLNTLGATLKLVLSGAGALISIIGGLGRAAENAGIGDLLTPLQGIAAIVNSPVFQTALTTLFAGAAGGAAGLLSALTPIGNLIAAIAPIVASFLTGAGQLLGGLFSNLAAALSAPVFQKGLNQFFTGILAFLTPLLPLMPLFAEKLALIASYAGNLLTVLGPVFASILQAVVPILGQIFQAVTPLTNALGPVLTGIIKALAPVLVGMVKVFTPILALVTGLLAPILDLVQVIASALTPYLKILQGVWAELLPPILDIVKVLVSVLIPLIGPLVGLVGQLVKIALKPLTLAFQVLAPVLKAISPILTLLAEIVGAVIQTIVDLMTGNFSDIGKTWSGVWQSMVDFYTGSIKPIFDAIGGFFASIFGPGGANQTALQGFGDFFTGIWNGIVGFFSPILDALFAPLQIVLNSISTTWNAVWQGISIVFANVWNIMSAVAILAYDAIWTNGLQPVLTALNDFWTSVWNNISGVFTAVWNAMIAFFVPLLKSTADFISSTVSAIQTIWNTTWSAIGSFFSKVWTGFVGFVSGPLIAVRDFISSTIGTIQSTWNKVWQNMSDFFGGIFGGLKGIVAGSMNGVIGIINGAIDGLNAVSAAASTVTGAKVARIPHIAKLAAGATVLPRTGGTLAILAEGGKPESVVDTGLLNQLLAQVTSAFPGVINAVNSANLRVAAGGGSGSSSVTNNSTTNNFPVPRGSDPAQVAQEFVNRAAEKVGL